LPRSVNSNHQERPDEFSSGVLSLESRRLLQMPDAPMVAEYAFTEKFWRTNPVRGEDDLTLTKMLVRVFFSMLV